MAKVFVSMYNFARHKDDYTIMPPFYETFVNGLKNAGNDVLCYFHKNFYMDFSGEMPKEVFEKFKSFDADIYIFFNNNFWDVTKYTDKPILVYDVDSPIFYKNLDKLKENPERYKFMTIQKGSTKVITDTFSIGDDRVGYVPPFTGVQKDENAEIKQNISFIGANWGWEGCKFVNDFMIKDISEEERYMAKMVYDEYTKEPFNTSDEIYERLGLNPKNKIKINNDMNSASRISGIKRLQYLEAISDLGLVIRGLYWSHPNTRYYPGVAFAYNKAPIFSLKENQDVFNSSKISFNINHIQAKTGFSWRVCDIMASNACLVTEYKPDYKEVFPNINLPTFTNIYEAREVCRKLLESPEERKEIVSACNEFIDKNYRFENTLGIIEDFMNVSMHDKEQEGSLEFIYDKPVKQENPAEKKIFIGNRAIRKVHHLLGIYLKKKGCI